MKKIFYLVFLVLFTLYFMGCAYYNTFYNAKKYYNSGKKIIIQSEEEGRLNQEAINNLDKAISKSKKVLLQYPGSRWSDDAQYLIAMSNFYKGNYEKARDAFEDFLYEYPDSEFRKKARIWYGKTLWNLDQREAARQEWKSASQIIQSDELMGELYFLIGEAFFENERYDSARTYYGKLADIKGSERKVEALFTLVDIAIKTDKNEEAVQYLDRLSNMVLLPDQLDKLQVLQLEIYRKQGKYEQAKKIINKKLNSEKNKNIWGALELQLALIYKEEGNIDKCISRLINITENYQNTEESAHAYYILGEINTFILQNYEEAAKYYSNVPGEFQESEFADEAQKKYDILTRFQEKNKKYNSTKKLINAIESEPDSSVAESDTMAISPTKGDSLSREEVQKQDEEEKQIQTSNSDPLASYKDYYRLKY